MNQSDALKALPFLASPLTQVFASFLAGAGLPPEQIAEMAGEFVSALHDLSAGKSPVEIAAGPARHAKPLDDEALFQRLEAEARRPRAGT